MSVALTAEMASMMRQLVEAGEYASASEVVREALRDWAFRRDQRGQAIEELKRQWNAGLADGPSNDGEAAFAEIGEDFDAEFAPTGNR